MSRTHTRPVGDVSVYPIALGGMLLSIEGRPGEEQAVDTVRTALAAGATMIDTADAYHAGADEVGHNEVLIAQAVEGVTPRPFIATKGGRVRPGDGRWLTDSSPAHLWEALRASRTRLGVERIDLYLIHAPDPRVPYRESLLALRDIVDAGLAARAGVSNVDVPQLELAAEVLGDRLVSVQNQFSPTHQAARGTLELAERIGIAFLAWRPLGRVAGDPESAASTALRRLAADHGVSVQRATLAWHLAVSPILIPLVGATRALTAKDSIAAADLDIPAEELIGVPVADD